MTDNQSAANFEEAARYFGITEHTLSTEEKQRIDDDGFIVIPNVLTPSELELLRHKYEELMQKEGRSAGWEVHQEKGTRRLSDLVNKGECFDAIYVNPKILAAVHHVIGREFKLTSLNARDAEPGEGHQDLHADWGSGRIPGEPYHVCNTMWLIDDFTAENGPTRLVPGTHKLPGTVRDHMGNPAAPHPDEKMLIAPAGSVCVFNGHVWHGGTRNRTETTRRAIHACYVGREFAQQLNQREYIRKMTYDRISPAARYILDV